MGSPPALTISANGISIAVWENTGQDGKLFRSYTISKSFKDKNDEWKKSGSFYGRDLPILANLLNSAFDSFEVKEWKPRNQDESSTPF